MSSPEPYVGDRLRRQYWFDEFIFDVEQRALRRGADEITLRPKSIDVLSYLVEHHGQLVTKAELMEAVWPDTAVTENSLAQCLVEIRRALGDDAQQLIRTVARRGYVFAAPMRTPPLAFPARQAAAPPPQAPQPVTPAQRTSTRLYLAGAGGSCARRTCDRQSAPGSAERSGEAASGVYANHQLHGLGGVAGSLA